MNTNIFTYKAFVFFEVSLSSGIQMLDAKLVLHVACKTGSHHMIFFLYFLNS